MFRKAFFVLGGTGLLMAGTYALDMWQLDDLPEPVARPINAGIATLSAWKADLDHTIENTPVISTVIPWMTDAGAALVDTGQGMISATASYLFPDDQTRAQREQARARLQVIDSSIDEKRRALNALQQQLSTLEQEKAGLEKTINPLKAYQPQGFNFMMSAGSAEASGNRALVGDTKGAPGKGSLELPGGAVVPLPPLPGLGAPKGGHGGKATTRTAANPALGTAGVPGAGVNNTASSTAADGCVCP